MEGNPHAQPRGEDKADIYTIREFISRRDCERLIASIDSRLGPSTLFHDSGGRNARTSSTHYFGEGDHLAANLRGQICDCLGIAPDHAEPMQGQRYLPGQEYRHHSDYFRENREHWQTERLRGGQRTWTAMVYLDSVQSGGETDFPQLDLRIVPEPGLLIVWDNMSRRGLPNRNLLHAGLPVEAGRKHVVTQWFRLEPWRYSASS